MLTIQYLLEVMALLLGKMEIEYSEEHWRLLKKLREKAMTLMKPLVSRGLNPIVYGSIARGDVDEESDIDIFIPYPTSTAILELYLNEFGIKVSRKLLVQATPSYVPKAYLVIDDYTSISLPLSRMRDDDVKDITEFEKRERRELSWGLGAVIASSDIIVTNDGSLDKFRLKIKNKLEELIRENR